MGTISERTDNSSAATFQAKIRRKGFPTASKTFPTRDEAEQWMLEAEAALLSRIAAAKQRLPLLERQTKAAEAPPLSSASSSQTYSSATQPKSRQKKEGNPHPNRTRVTPVRQ